MGTLLNTFQQVSAPASVPYRYGLFSVVEPRTASIEGTTLDEHWRLGVQFTSQSCALIGRTTGPCIEPDSPIAAGQVCDILQYDPFTVFAFNEDSVPGRTLAENEANAIERLVHGEQFQAEVHLRNLLVNATSASVIDATAFPSYIGLGYAEQLISEEYAAQGVIHMDRQTAMACSLYLRVEGGRMVTNLGTPVVVGAGYSRAPFAPKNTAQIWASGPLVMYRGDIDTRENAINKPINSVSIIAQRDYVLGWDCSAFALNISLCDSCTPTPTP